MPKQRMINTGFWEDGYIRRLTKSQRLLFLYFLTAPAHKLSGIYECPNDVISFHTGLEEEEIIKGLEKLSQDRKVYPIPTLHTQYVYLLNYKKFLTSASPIIQKAVERERKGLPPEILKAVEEIDTLGLAYPYPSGYSNLNFNLNLTDSLVPKNSGQGKKEEPPEEPKKTKSFDDKSIELELAQLLFDLIRKNNPKCRAPNLQSWAGAIDKMLRIDQRDIQEVKFLMEWAESDKFWKTVVLSAEKFREKYDQLWIKAKADFETFKEKEQKKVVPHFTNPYAKH